MRRAASAAVFVLLLLTAQFGALMHAVWHAGADGHAHAHAQQPGADVNVQDNDAPAGQTTLCAFDLAFGQVLGGVHAAAAPLPTAAIRGDTLPELPASRLHADTLTPKSRGPPTLL